MNFYKTLIVSAVILITFQVHSEPQYASKKTKEVIEKMIQAHGGYDTWKNAPAIRFDNIMHNNYHGPNEFAWWVSHEVFEQGSRRAYQQWKLDQAKIAYNGEEVWSHNWKRANPIESQLFFFYYFVNLPWLTQDDGVILSEVKDFQWPDTDQVYYEIKMTFSESPAVGKSEKDYFVLYIDKTNYLLRGYQYAVGNKALLKALGQPPERELFGPLWRVITKYSNVDGLIFPAAFRTMPEANERIVGNHLILNIDISTPFDPSEVKKWPSEASSGSE